MPNPVDVIVQRASAKYHVPEQVINAVIGRESGGRRDARSPKGAMSYMQLMPDTARALGVTDPYDAEQNIMAGTRYLAEQKQRFGSWDLAFAAYNAGPGAVQKYGGIPPYAETQAYVKALMPATRRFAVSTYNSPDTIVSAAAGRPPRQTAAAPPSDTTAVSPLLQSVYNANNELLGVPSIDLGAITPATQQRKATQPQGLPVPVVREFRGKQPKVVGKVLNLAREYLGTPYSWGGGGPSGPTKGIGRGANTVGFDCSGFIEFLYARQGIEVGGVTYEQWKRGRPVDIKALQAGDAVFFHAGAQGPEHVGLYLGQGKFMHSPKTGDVVKISKLTDSYYRQSFVGGRRYT